MNTNDVLNKLIAEIERQIEETKSMKPSFDQFWAGQISAFKGAIKIAESLQQEQPEKELSEFEKAVGLEIFDEPFEERHIKVIKEESAKLLVLAREQLIKDSYVIEKKEFHNAVEKVAPEVMKEVSDKVDMEEALCLGYEKGKAEALKDLPRWKRWENGACGNGQGIPIAIVKRGLNGYELVDALGIQGEQYIILSDLEKLPGFNEDEK